MKKTILSLCILLISIFSTIGQTNNNIISPPKVDKRVELLSIVFRLAGSPEYNSDRYGSYVKDIHNHFDKYKNHPVIKYAKLIRKMNVGYDAVMSMAIHLEQPPSLKPLIPFNDSIPNYRWSAKNSRKFIKLLQQFYIDAKCEDFFKEHESLYLIAEERFKLVLDSLDVNWYKDFFGKEPNENFNIILGFGNGCNSYGPQIKYLNKKTDVYAIIGACNIDSIGIPVYAVKNYLLLLVHEFNHSFVNQLIDENLKQLESSGKILFQQVEAKMKSQAYGNWRTMMYESLVRASEIPYMKKHEMNFESMEMYELSKGFLWINELVDLLDQYEKERKTYPTLESFMPQIISFYQTTATNITTIKENYDSKIPHVLSIQPFENDSKKVDPNIKEIKIHFDKPLLGKGYSFKPGDKNFDPKIGKIGYIDDNMGITIEVDLKPNREYYFILMGYAFKTKEGFPLEN